MLITEITKKPNLKFYWTVDHMFEVEIFILAVFADIYDGRGMTLKNTVNSLLSPRLGSGYQVYVDNYCNSIRLSQ